ncbi:MAG: ABC transporter ATP-binding protein [Ruminiclostridium sp.]
MKKYIFKHKGWLFLAIISYLIGSLCNISIAFIVKGITEAGVNKDLSMLYQYILIGSAVTIIYIIFRFYGFTSINSYWKRTTKAIRNDMMDRILNMDMDGFNKSNSGKYISMLNYDVKIFEQDYIGCVPSVLSNCCLILCTIAAMFYMSVKIAVIALLASALPMLVPMIFGGFLSRRQEETTKATEEYNIRLKDVFTGFEIVKSYGIAGYIRHNHDKWNMGVEDRQYHYRQLDAVSGTISEGLIKFVFLLLLLCSMFEVIAGNITLGTMMGIVQLLNYILFPFGELSSKLNKFKAAKKVNERLERILTLEYGKGKDNSSKVCLSENFQALNIKNLTYYYENTEAPAVNNINLTFEAGKKYAIVGTSGSGKSTLLKLILNYYSSYEGNIRINDTDIQAIDEKCLYRYISMIHQNVFLFDDTIKNNITLFAEYTEEKVINAIEEAGLKEKMNNVVNGIEYNVEEAGLSLSGGERQRIAIARAIIRDTAVMLLDEATSGLDNKTAYQIESMLLQKVNFTAIVVTHKLSADMLARYDEIIVMKAGNVVEKGTFEELMDRKEEFYSLFRVAN